MGLSRLKKGAAAISSVSGPLRTVKAAWSEFSLQDGPQAAAAFSFFAFLSIFALLALAGGVLGMVLRDRPDLLRRMVDYVARQAPGLSDMVEEALNTSRNLGGTLGVIGLLTLFLTGTKAADSLQLWLARIWNIRKPAFLKRKLKSLVILLVLATSVGLGFGIYALLVSVARKAGALETPFYFLALASTVFVQFIGLTFVYAYSLDLLTSMGRVWKGALLAILLSNPLQFLLTWYYSNMGNLSAVYGSFAAAAMAVTIIYYTAYMIFMGAAFNLVLSRKRETLDGHEEN